jgi:hypothetical protein
MQTDPDFRYPAEDESEKRGSLPSVDYLDIVLGSEEEEFWEEQVD